MFTSVNSSLIAQGRSLQILKLACAIGFVAHMATEPLVARNCDEGGGRPDSSETAANKDGVDIVFIDDLNRDGHPVLDSLMSIDSVVTLDSVTIEEGADSTRGVGRLGQSTIDGRVQPLVPTWTTVEAHCEKHPQQPADRCKVHRVARWLRVAACAVAATVTALVLSSSGHGAHP